MKACIAATLVVALAGAAAAQDHYYLRSTQGAPWGVNTNEQAMTKVFGGAWTDARFETVNVGQLFSADTKFIYMEGGDFTANAMNSFLSNNMGAMENWVAAGGCLVITSAPNEGGNINLGFGMTLHYPIFLGATLNLVDPNHPIGQGPFVPAGPSFTGNYNSHAHLTGPATPVAVDEFGLTTIAELAWGNGGVLFGSITTDNWWDPQPNANNFRANMIVYACTIPAPGVAALLGLGGLVAARRRR